jgi:iron complex outermembrane recepter protein
MKSYIESLPRMKLSYAPFFLIAALLLLSHIALGQTTDCTFTLQLVDGQNQTPASGAAISYKNKQGGSQAIPESMAITDINGITKINYTGWPLIIRIDFTDVITTFEIDKPKCDEILTYALSMPEIQTAQVVVTSFLHEKKLSTLPAEVGYISRKTLNSNDQTSLQNAVNTIPGVIMESRGYGGSHRLNIRGSALRAPFAVRNVKMYLAGIPLTSPDGQTPLELLDAGEASSIEIIKGPAGSIYGSGNGGVLLIQPKIAYANQLKTGVFFQGGSYDVYRAGAYADIGFATSGLRISHVWQDNPGYREQEFNRKNQVSLTYTKYLRQRDRLLLYGTYYAGNWALPGALSAAQVIENPRQANNFSKTNNASVQRNRLMGALSYEYFHASGIKGTTSVYAYSTHKLNPYGTSAFNSGYKDEGSDGFGGRTVWNARIHKASWNGAFEVGGEWQAEQYNIIENTIDSGKPDEFRYLYDIGYIAAMAFSQASINFRNTFFIDAGMSYNSNRQQVKGRTSDSFIFDTTASWGSAFLPRLAFSIQLPGNIFLYHSISYGNANPTAFEMVDYENNSYNLQLRPERGISKEWGLRQNSAKSPFSFSVNYYDFKLTNMIVPIAVSGPDDDMISLYRNAAATHQRGLEWSIAMLPLTLTPGLEIGMNTSGSVFRYAYENFESNGIIFNDKRIPGIPNANVVSGMNIIVKKKVNIDIFHYWYDKMPLDNANQNWTASYHLLNAAISTTFQTGKPFELKVQGGINNLLGTEYSSFLALNATNGRFYNPMPGINFFAGIALGYSKN